MSSKRHRQGQNPAGDSGHVDPKPEFVDLL